MYKRDFSELYAKKIDLEIRLIRLIDIWQNWRLTTKTTIFIKKLSKIELYNKFLLDFSTPFLYIFIF